MVVEVRTIRAEPGPLSTSPVDAFTDKKIALVRRHASRLGSVHRIDLIAVRLWSKGVDFHWIPRV